MPELTRRRHDDPHREGYNVYFGDVRVGHIGVRAGVPKDVDQWGWTCGFHPGCDTQKHGIGPTLEACRQDFQAAWDKLHPTLTEVHFELWRRQRDWTAWKYRMFEARLPLPAAARGRSTCFCGTEITQTSVEGHVHSVHRGIGA
ncbi:hypothetical protein [Bradyrhizobium phage BDU-MI-1]|nr:hypothetical protein [Bradyrhizobium phage BDU-MI-1]